MAHPVDLLVDRAVLLDIGVGARDIGFRLVIIVIRDEILDRVLREERLELAVKLSRERLIGRENERGPLGFLDHLRHGEGLARAGHAKQHLLAFERAHACDKLADCAWLIAARLEIRFDYERPAALALFGPRRPVRHEQRHIGAGQQRVVANGRQLAKLMRRLRHRTGGLQIAQRRNEMRRAFGGVSLALECGLRAFSKSGRGGFARLLEIRWFSSSRFGRALFPHTSYMPPTTGFGYRLHKDQGGRAQFRLNPNREQGLNKTPQPAFGFMTMPAIHSKPAYRPDIDGLRAIAVLAVVFYHAGLPGFSGGFVGVDVFFVISGFLITQIVWSEIEGERFSLYGILPPPRQAHFSRAVCGLIYMLHRCVHNACSRGSDLLRQVPQCDGSFLFEFPLA